MNKCATKKTDRKAKSTINRNEKNINTNFHVNVSTEHVCLCVQVDFVMTTPKQTNRIRSDNIHSKYYTHLLSGKNATD